MRLKFLMNRFARYGRPWWEGAIDVVQRKKGGKGSRLLVFHASEPPERLRTRGYYDNLILFKSVGGGGSRLCPPHSKLVSTKKNHSGNPVPRLWCHRLVSTIYHRTGRTASAAVRRDDKCRTRQEPPNIWTSRLFGTFPILHQHIFFLFGFHSPTL